MEDRDFFDVLYQGWSKTTGAENTFWMPEEGSLGGEAEGAGYYTIYAVNEKQERTIVGWGLKEADAAFITAIHGCFADLTRRLHMAVDEADRLDEAGDERESKVAELTLRVMELEQENQDMKMMLHEVGR